MRKLFTLQFVLASIVAINAQSPKADGVKIIVDSAQLIFDYYPSLKLSTKLNQPKPLLLLNGKTFQYDSLTLINPITIESIEVLKGKVAQEAYGEEGKNGVVKITLKPVQKE